MYRRCDRQARAETLFWTIGPRQVGKAALAGWGELGAELAAGAAEIGIWPFADPSVDQLLGHYDFVVAETYPAAFYPAVGVVFPPRSGGKGNQGARMRQAPALLRSAEQLDVELLPQLTAAIRAGFATEHGRDDGFDATVGLLGLLQILAADRFQGAPVDEAVLTIEGWMLGLGA